MLRLRVLVAMAGPTQAWSVGDVYECDAVAAARLVAAGRAEYLDPPAPPSAPEAAMAVPAPERAVRPRARGRG